MRPGFESVDHPEREGSRRSAMKMSGARIVLESLKREGVDVVFGLPGGAAW